MAQLIRERYERSGADVKVHGDCVGHTQEKITRFTLLNEALMRLKVILYLLLATLVSASRVLCG
jgi:hypothetical protein